MAVELPTIYQSFIHVGHYARYRDDLGRRETWEETVNRYIDFFKARTKTGSRKIPWDELRSAILNLEVMPSMRALMTAGPALEKDQVAGYNCSYLPIDNQKAFDEIMYILSCGTGVGFSVESRYTNKLPEIPDELHETDTTIVFKDSKIGWASGYREYISLLYSGKIAKWDVSLVRPAGARLKTFGGRASGPEPLVDLLRFTTLVFNKAKGRKLSPLECHDIVCKVADVIVSGGVRRSALISLTDLNDDKMRLAKSGNWWLDNNQRALANISAVYEDKPDIGTFMSEWLALYNSHSGERGIFSRKASQLIAAQFGRRDPEIEYGVNPCVTADMLVSTDSGLCKVQDLINKEFNVIRDGISYHSNGFWETGFKEVFKVVTEHGYEFKATSNHKILTKNYGWMELGNLNIEDELVINNTRRDLVDLNNKEKDLGWIVGEVVGDGCHNPEKYHSKVVFWGNNAYQMANTAFNIIENIQTCYSQPVKPECPIYNDQVGTFHVQSKKIDELCSNYIDNKKNILPSLECESLSFISGFIQGLYDADGTVVGHPHKKGISLQLVQINRANLIAVQRMLLQFGIVSHIRLGRSPQMKLLPDNKGFGEYKEYYCQQLYRLDIGRDSIELFEKYIGFRDKHKADKLSNLLLLKKRESYRSRFSTKIVEIRSAGFEKVYDCTVPGIDSFDVNGIVVHNCSEIILRPYQFCVSSDTPLITSCGIHKISDLENRSVNIWNGEEWTEVTIRKTGTDQKLMRVHLSDGSYLDCTPDHRWSIKNRFQNNWSEIQTKDLMTFSKYSIQVEPANVKALSGGETIHNAYTLGFAYGDGCVYKERVIIDAYGEKDWKCPISGSRHKIIQKIGYNIESQRIDATNDVDVQLLKKMKYTDLGFNPLSTWDRESVLNFVAGLADADGSLVPSGGIRVYISDENKARQMQLILTKNGIRSSVNLCQKSGVKTNIATRKKDLWYLQITSCEDIPCHRLDTSRGHAPKFKGKYQNVVSVEFIDGLHDTFCFNEPKRHMGLFGNVMTYQCNLTEVVVRAGDSLQNLKHKVRLATILGTLQSTLSDFRYINKKWKKNTEEERLLGVSLTGIMDSKMLNGQSGKVGFAPAEESLGEALKVLREVAVTTNVEFADYLDVEHSAAITCVKPSGTVSQLVDSASGIHPRYAPYYIRRVRLAKTDPLGQFMMDNGYKAEEDFYNKSNWVFSFPMKAPEGSRLVKDMTAIDQLEHWLIFQDNWCEHKPSITVYVGEDEWLKVGAWVYDHLDRLSGVSFLPRDTGTYRQAPYEQIDEVKYNELLSTQNVNLDWTQFKEEQDNTENSKTLNCSAGVCEL